MKLIFSLKISKELVEVHFSRSEIFVLYFYDAYDANLWGKKFGRSTAYSCRTNVFIEFHFFMKKNKTQLKTKQLKQNIFKSVGIYGLY